jgi:tRNA dimethylallyltransferase
MKYKICEDIGFCGGVRSAIWTSVLSVEKGKKVVIFGNLIHNERVLQELSLNHVSTATSFDQITAQTRVIIPAHGITKENLAQLGQITDDVVDMTCPMVIKLRKHLVQLTAKGYTVILLGKKNHPEIVGAVSFANKDKILIVENKEELSSYDLNHEKYALLSQTTSNSKVFSEIVDYLRQFPDLEIEIHNTLCPTVCYRQNFASNLPLESDVVIVIGDSRSSNTLSLYEISKTKNPTTFLVESSVPYHLEPAQIEKINQANQISILAGTSSPSYTIDELKEYIDQKMTKGKTFKPVIVLFGPTAVGKTETAENLAEKMGGEIINCDSMQIYKRLNIGTAKPDIINTRVPYHLVDIVDPDHHFSAAKFRKLANEKIEDIFLRNKVPIVAGGSYLYLESLIDGLFEMEPSNQTKEIRENLDKELAMSGLSFLFEELKKVDPKASNHINQNDQKRILRALEVYRTTGEPISKLQIEKTRPLPFFFIKIGLVRSMNHLYSRINDRVFNMIQEGVLVEVQNLMDNGYGDDIEYIKAHGYRELMQALQNKITLPEALETMKRNTRHYSKRQMSWLRQRSDFHLLNLDAGDSKEMIQSIQTMIQKIQTLLTG